MGLSFYNLTNLFKKVDITFDSAFEALLILEIIVGANLELFASLFIANNSAVLVHLKHA